MDNVTPTRKKRTQRDHNVFQEGTAKQKKPGINPGFFD